MGNYIKLTGSTNVHENWTAEYILEVNEETGEPTKVIRAGEPLDISADERKKLESFGAVFEDSSAAEAKEFEESQSGALEVGGDVASASPLLGSGSPDQPNQKSGKTDPKTNN